MDSLDLDVKHTFRVDFNFAFSSDPIGQFYFVLFLNCSPFVSELRIVDVFFQLTKSAHIQNPFISSQIFSVKLSKSWICT